MDEHRLWNNNDTIKVSEILNPKGIYLTVNDKINNDLTFVCMVPEETLANDVNIFIEKYRNENNIEGSYGIDFYLIPKKEY